MKFFQKNFLLSITISIVLICGCNNENSDNLTIKVGETKIHGGTGLKIFVGTRNLATVIAVFKYVFSSEESEQKANNAYDFAKKLGLDEILVCTVIFPDGSTEDIALTEHNQPFYFGLKNQNYRVDVTEIDKTLGNVKVSFKISITKEIIASKNLSNETSRLLPNQNKKYNNITSNLKEGATYNDEKTGLHILIRSIKLSKQVVIADYHSPDFSEVKSAILKEGEVYTFLYNQKIYEFKVLQIETSNCKFRVREQ